jgi:DNA-binding NarL/FixJ family response regulator
MPVSGAGVGTASDVVGREGERARIDEFVGGLRAGARSLTIGGEPGIGKTVLWRHAVGRCRDAGYRVLLARPGEDELPLALAGLVDLFEDVGGSADVARAELDQLGRGRAVLEALRRLAETAPTVVAIDDAQWLDPASARALRYAYRRLEAEPVGLLATRRRDSGPDELVEVGAERHEAVELGPVSLGVLRAILGRVVAAISRPTLRRIHELSGGNPLYAVELARALESGSWDGLALPDSLQDAIAHRLDGAPAELQRLLETAAGLGPASVEELRAALPELELDPSLALAEEHGLLLLEDDLTVRFAHPLLGSAVYGNLGPLARRSLHAGLAQRTEDPDGRARHLALSTDGADEAVAQLLEDAAGRAASRGAPDLAAEFERHAVSLTPPEEAAAGRRRALAEMTHLASAGEVGRALVLAEQLIEAMPPGPERAEVLVRYAALEGDDFPRVEALLAEALVEAGEDELLRGRVLDEIGFLRGSLRGDLVTGLDNAREALAIAERLGDRSLELSAAIAVADLEGLMGALRLDVGERALALEQEIGVTFLAGSPRMLFAKQRRQSGDLPGARALFEEIQAELGRTGDERTRPYVLYDLACLDCYSGELASAAALVEAAAQAARDSENTHVGVWALYPRALVAAWLGRADEARAAAREIVAWAEQRGARPVGARARSLLGLLALSEGDSAGAVAELREAVALVDAMGLDNALAIPARPDGVDAFVAAGDAPAARELLTRIERQPCEGVPLLQAIVDRCRGVVLAAEGEPDAAVAPLQRSVAGFDALGFRPDGARAVLALGRALLRAGHRVRAADAFSDALRRFGSMGATLWEARAAEELERAAPGRAKGELTRTEQRVAALVAEGRRNKEIGAELYLSVATVEAHLTRIYRKLEIRSRSELVRLVADGRVTVSEV